MKLEATQFYSEHKRHLKEPVSKKSLPLSSYPMTQFNNRYLERPLKNNQLDDLSFKGLSFSGSEKEENKPKKPINPTLVLLGTVAVAGLGLRFLAPRYKFASKFSEKSFNEFTQKYIGADIGKDLLNNLKVH